MNSRLVNNASIIWIAFSLLACSGSARAHPVQLALWNPVQLVGDEADIRGLRINLLYGRNRDVYGLDVGTINLADRDCYGLQIGAALNDAGFFNGPAVPGRIRGVQLSLLSNSADEATGLQAGTLFNLLRDDLQGVQLSWLVNVVKGDTRGLQAGMANVTLNAAVGAQAAFGLIAALNVAQDLRGAQISAAALALNKADTVSGLQCNLGLLGNQAAVVDGVQLAATCNIARKVRGVQVGLVNYCRTLAGLQIGLVNIVADGALPVLPVMNTRW